MRAALHVIAGPGPGQLATMAHPRGEPWPAEQLSALARAGVDIVVSAVTAAEQQRLGFGGTAAVAAAAGVEFVSFPVEEGGVPRAEAAAVVALAAWMAAHVRAGRFVVTQTFGGIGRSTLLACTTLTLLGISPGEALRRITPGEEPHRIVFGDAPRRVVPGATDEPVRRDWLHEFAASHAGR